MSHTVTPRQLAANRRNAALGGPKTEAGRCAVRFNALDTVLTAASVVLPGEREADFDALRHDLFQSWLPANSKEMLLFDEVVRAAWRLARARNVETEMLAEFTRAIRRQHGAPADAPDASACHRALAGVYSEISDARFHNFFRSERAIERSFYRAVAQLESLQRTRRRRAEVSENGNGTVLHCISENGEGLVSAGNP